MLAAASPAAGALLGITGKSGEKPARSRHCMWEATGNEPLELWFGEGCGLR